MGELHLFEDAEFYPIPVVIEGAIENCLLSPGCGVVNSDPVLGFRVATVKRISIEKSAATDQSYFSICG